MKDIKSGPTSQFRECFELSTLPGQNETNETLTADFRKSIVERFYGIVAADPSVILFYVGNNLHTCLPMFLFTYSGIKDVKLILI